MTVDDSSSVERQAEVTAELARTRELSGGPASAEDLLVQAVAARATDIHFDPNHDHVDVRVRIDGRLEHFGRLEHKAALAVLSQFKLMADLDIAEPFRAKEGRLRLPASLDGYQVRITTARVVEGEAAALRLLDSRRLKLPLSTLGFSPFALNQVQAMLEHGEGLILVTGPTNAGKTTTVYSMLHELDNGQSSIVTVEDPVEYEMPSFRQMAVDPRHEVTMTSGLKTLLRMDPDVVLVGEIRDAETAEIAMRAASSGKRVLSTLHTRDVPSTITALRDLRVDKRSLAGNLAGVVSQRLVRKVCPKCCRVEAPTDEEREFFSRAGHEAPAQVAHAVGCDHCRLTGYFERIGVFEVSTDFDLFRTAITAGATEDELRNLLREAQVPTLLDDALTKVASGVTTAAEVQSMSWVSAKAGPLIVAAPRTELAAIPAGAATEIVAQEITPANDSGAYRVVLFGTPDDAAALRDVLVAKLGMHPTDAMIHARQAPGILSVSLSQGAAEQFAQVANETGLHAEAVAQRDIPDLAHPESVHHARVLDAGFSIIELHGNEEMIISWSDIELLSVGRVPQESHHAVIADESITAAHRTSTAGSSYPAAGPELWLVRRDPVRAFRVSHQRMNYEYLGSRKTDSATHNFRLFVEDMLSKAPQAYITPATRAFVGHGPQRHYEFVSTDELREYTLFHLLLRLRAEATTSAEKQHSSGA
jgi:type II secretory ATPase GspE/PulE/Tfp pilus assembly ATPase PilB-like protein